MKAKLTPAEEILLRDALRALAPLRERWAARVPPPWVRHQLAVTWARLAVSQ